MSVKSRILQFQNQSSTDQCDHQHPESRSVSEVKPSLSSCVKFNNGTSITTHHPINGNSFNVKSRSPTPPPTYPKQESLGTVMSNNTMSNSQQQNFMGKPATMSKKTSLSINLNSSSTSPMNGNQSGSGSIVGNNGKDANDSSTKLFSKQPRTPTRTTSSIPKPTASTPVTPNTNNSSTLQSNGFSRGALWNSNGVGHQNGPTTVSAKAAAAPIVSPGCGQRYSDIDWKTMFEESEKKRLHVVILAQKATRDYEELRRRFNDTCGERDKLSGKLVAATGQLDSLRQASEAAYGEYYKLKKQYENENRNKAEALNRVDQYNKENRRLKRASALMMQQIHSDPNFTIEEEIEGVENNAENDKEIAFLRQKNQGLEQKIVILESELEKIKLAEFETQENVLLMNDTVADTKIEATQLKDMIRKLEQENRKLHDSLDDAVVELDNIKKKDFVEQQKLRTAESELRRIRTEKNVLQRQSLVFMADTSDNRLMDALSQIGDLQTALEDQKNNFQKKMSELHTFISEKDVQEETLRIQVDAHVKALEEEIQSLRRRNEEAERKLEEFPEQESFIPIPPPPPPPIQFCSPPPPPPLPTNSMNSSISAGLKTLKKTTVTTTCEPSEDNVDGSKSQIPGNPQIDDVVSQIKKGIKLRPSVDRTLTKKQTEVPDKFPESQAVEEMRSILNNLKRTRRF